MRWDALFEDLEAEYAALEAVQVDAEVRDRVRREAATLRLLDRLAAARGSAITAHVMGGLVRGPLLAAGPDWLLISEAQGWDALIPAAAVASITGLGRWSGVPGAEGKVGAKLDFRYALRGIARNRASVAATLRDMSICAGTIDRVGSDFIEIAEHATGEARRPSAVIDVRTVPLASIVVVRSG